MRHTDDDAVELSQEPSDIANVRDAAWTPAHAVCESDPKELPAADDVNIQLDPVGVLLQDTTSSVRTLFSNLRKLVAVDGAASSEPDSSGDPNAAHEEKKSDDEPENTDAIDLDTIAANRDDSTGAPRVHFSKRSSTPLNEFSENATILYGSFWDLFPLRSGLRHDGPLHPTQRRHLLTQFHNSFAQCSTFLFLLANQIQRHAAAQGVALRVQADP
jgi:hypothetical protein